VPSGPEFPGFSRSWLIFEPSQRTWRQVDEATLPLPARVTAPSVQFQNRYVILSGESAPGIRTPTVISLNLLP
jgi:N-acetylneuraminic acid mutarotase